MDQKRPSGEDWHRDLLRQMTQDLVDVRPAVISRETALIMDRFLRFRHLVQNIYVTNLQADKRFCCYSISWPGMTTHQGF